LSTLDALQPFERLDELPLRIPILDKYRESGKVYIMGKVETGILKQGDEIFINPNGMKFAVVQIQNDEFIISLAKPGENVKVVIKCLPVEEDYICRGSVISHPPTPCPVSSELVGQIVILQLLETKPIFTAGYKCIFHVGTAVEEVKVVKLLDQLDKTQKSIKKNPTFVKEKGITIAHLSLAKPICVEKFTDYPQIGRFTLRDEGKTIGFGKLLALNAPVAVKKKKTT